MAQSICFYFQVHQPYRIRPHRLRYQPENHDYFKGVLPMSNEAIFEKVSQKCYLPTNKLLLELLQKHPDFHISFACSGVFLEQCATFGTTGKAVLQSFKDLSQQGKTEFLAETYHHSLSFLYSKQEFVHQIQEHGRLIEKYFDQKPKVFRNTELIYRDDLGEFIRLMGYEGIIAEGWHTALPEDHPNIIRQNHTIELGNDDFSLAQKYKIQKPKHKNINILTKNYKLSDDIAFRFSQSAQTDQPLTAETFADWVIEEPGDTINLFMDYETFGEHQWEETGIFEFLRHLPQACADRGIVFRTPSQTIQHFQAAHHYHAPEFISWADAQRDISAWIENDMQRHAFKTIKSIEAQLHPHLAHKKKDIQDCIADFRKLQTSDHLYYMSTKFWSDGDVHTYFSPYENPYDAYINYMNTIHHLEWRLDLCLKAQKTSPLKKS